MRAVNPSGLSCPEVASACRASRVTSVNPAAVRTCGQPAQAVPRPGSSQTLPRHPITSRGVVAFYGEEGKKRKGWLEGLSSSSPMSGS
ncbi:MAG: hypothetical protein QXH32_08825 [Candidatus Caldarchaeum sp.]